MPEIYNNLDYLELYFHKYVGLESDGASVMFGNRASVGQLLRKDSPQFAHIHLVVHRHSLARSDAAKNIPF